MKRIRIAIDGPASSGKGTLARKVAHELGYSYLDTGAMYRLVGFIAQEEGLDLRDADRMTELAQEVDIRIAWSGGRLQIWAGERELTTHIRTEEAGRAASDVAVHPGVRKALVSQQQRMASEGGVVMDGRDIGTVVLPSAELKIYLEATPVERARRRSLELSAKGLEVDPQKVLEQIQLRDHQDSNRAASPLRAADDAIVLDSTELTPEEVCEQVVGYARQRLAGDS
jgi:cytidylate kinase